MPKPPVSTKVVQELVDKTLVSKGMFSQKVFKDTLRFLIDFFGKVHYIDRNNNVVQIKCFHANQERAIAKTTTGDNITLPVITISEESSEDSVERRKYGPMLLHETYWHKIAQRAVRTLCLVPTPVTIKYNVNIWTKYKEDMDQVREYILTAFNPDVEVDTKFSNVTKAFLVSESPTEQDEAEDAQDRVLKKTISIKVETYIPSPKFLYTSTGKIEKLVYQVGKSTISTADVEVPEHDMICTCDECLVPIILYDGQESGIPVECQSIEFLIDDNLGF